MSGIGGAPDARSTLGLRLALALVGLVAGLAGLIGFPLAGAPWAYTVVAAVIAVTAAVDLVVITRRRRAAPQ